MQVHPAHPAPACGCAHATAPVRPVAVAVAVAVAVHLRVAVRVSVPDTACVCACAALPSQMSSDMCSVCACCERCTVMRARFVVLFVVCIHFTIDIVTAKCIAKDSCDVDCGICEQTDSRDTCTQIGFCAWASSCGPAPECSWFNTSACTSATVATSEQQDLCALAQSSSACADMDFCEWKDDCRECSKLTANRDCVSRDFCVWDQGTLPKYPITSAYIAFTVASLLC